MTVQKLFPQRSGRVLALAFVGLSCIRGIAAGNTTCAGNLTDWYTNAVGETACETYQRLRQICNPQYQVPSFRPNTPGDQCDDQLQECCCNSISWALSMLCMNCQWDAPGGPSIGIDAGTGAYAMYRAPTGPFCAPGTNQSLPADIQTAVCNSGIKLDNFLYELFWVDGSWSFVYTMETASRDQATNNNNTFTHCNSTTPSATQSTAKSTSTSTPTTQVTSSDSHTTTATLAGAVVGGVVGLALLLGLAFVCWRKRSRHQPIPTEIDEPVTQGMDTVTPYTLTSSTPAHSSQYVPGYTSKQGHRPTHSNVSTSIGASRSEGGRTLPSQSSSDIMRSTTSAPASEHASRHEDLGPVPGIGRSPSGRLPPAYNPQWDAQRPRSSNIPATASVPNARSK
ncbi:hypothetical protein HYDPIDRAFT_108200 [Hydnomerulius pinastri MD-312]|nr:hypothetical protein HYDPIDRAFT_108200 [Hydnomerulius pinastri MD-312]